MFVEGHLMGIVLEIEISPNEEVVYELARIPSAE